MVPVQRKSRSQSKMGRSNKKAKATHTITCPNCGTPKRPHAACMDCGYVRPGLSVRTGKDD